MRIDEWRRAMDDTISRAGAIDALERIFDRCEEIEAHLPEGDPDRVGYKMYPDWLKVWNYLHQLPSAQSEIVRCKECKYWMPHSQLGYDEDNETYHDYCGKLIPEDDYYAFYRDADDYCSRAERRTDG